MIADGAPVRRSDTATVAGVETAVACSGPWLREAGDRLASAALNAAPLAVTRKLGLAMYASTRRISVR